MLDQLNRGLFAPPLEPSEREWIKALYLGKLACHDAAFARFFDQLRADGTLDDTLLVVTADHGEELSDRGKWGHGSSLYDEQVRVPLVIRHPGTWPAGAVVDDVVELVDLAPTLLEGIGAPPLPRADGVSLMPLAQGAPVMRPAYAISRHDPGHAARAIRAGRYKLIVVDPAVPARAFTFHWKLPDMAPGTYLYDLGADPGETRSRTDELPVARRLCEVLLGEGLASPAKGRRVDGTTSPYQHRSVRATIDPQLRRQLEALGYLSE